MDNSVAPLQCLLTFSGHLSHSKMHNLIALLPLLQPCGPKPPITPPKPLELRKNQGRRPPPPPSTMEFAISVESWSNLPPSLCLSHSFDSTTWKLKLFGKCQSQLIIATEAASTTSPCCSTICSQPLVLVPTSEFPFPPFFLRHLSYSTNPCSIITWLHRIHTLYTCSPPELILEIWRPRPQWHMPKIRNAVT